MNERMILLKAVDGRWEGWRCMAFEEFLQRIDLGALRSGQFLVGMVLAPASVGGSTSLRERKH